MGNLRVLALAGLAVIASLPAAHAADLPPLIGKAIPVIEDFAGGWYLRGDIGMTNQRVDKLDNVLFPGTANLVIRDKNFESGMLFGVGVGYQFNSWLRFDVTGEYRGETGFQGLDTWTDGGGLARFNNYTAKKSEWVTMANAYFDLGTWYGVTPFVGAGIGASRVTIASFRDAGIDGFLSPTMAYANAASKWNFAWAVHAGLAYKVSNAFTVELAYRYINLGSGQSGDIIGYDGTNAVYDPMLFKDIDSHDVKLGVRWNFSAPPPAYFPLMTKG